MFSSSSIRAALLGIIRRPLPSGSDVPVFRISCGRGKSGFRPDSAPARREDIERYLPMRSDCAGGNCGSLDSQRAGCTERPGEVDGC